ncbi:hypothetical protein [Methanococcus maripaludis]|uniref:Uncharacterized protein n=1 Tax=Methanococcus maripaludis TaxID=39152 RepID=A0A8T4H528_METMI|nr:hypothetical protein [Methanococcus maripaludis]MBM7408777.1 hypothetical protein [Methanococcus maripaludis]MBP2219054.1 hypothetical protein [Methanococcus maripaludis]
MLRYSGFITEIQEIHAQCAEKGVIIKSNVDPSEGDPDMEVEFTASPNSTNTFWRIGAEVQFKASNTDISKITSLEDVFQKHKLLIDHPEFDGEYTILIFESKLK